jgi:hypothetical protein
MVSLGERVGRGTVQRSKRNRVPASRGEEEKGTVRWKKGTVRWRWSNRVSPGEEKEQDQSKGSLDIPKTIWKRRKEVFKDEVFKDEEYTVHMPSGAKGAK